MYVYRHTYISISVYTQTHTYTYINTYTYIHTHIHVCIYEHPPTQMFNYWPDEISSQDRLCDGD